MHTTKANFAAIAMFHPVQYRKCSLELSFSHHPLLTGMLVETALSSCVASGIVIFLDRNLPDLEYTDVLPLSKDPSKLQFFPDFLGGGVRVSWIWFTLKVQNIAAGLDGLKAEHCLFRGATR